MAEFSLHGLKEANQFLNTQDKKHADMATQLEGAINNLDKKITEYLVYYQKNHFHLQTLKNIQF